MEDGAGVREARIAADFLNRFRRSLALTPALSRRERGLFGVSSLSHPPSKDNSGFGKGFDSFATFRSSNQ